MKDGPKGGFFETALASALDLGLLTEDELLNAVSLAALVESVSPIERAAVLDAALYADAFNAELIVRTIGIAVICRDLAPQKLWLAVALAGERVAGAEGKEADVRVSVPTNDGLRALGQPSNGAGISSQHAELNPREISGQESSDSVASATADLTTSAAESSSDSRMPDRLASGAGATSRRRSRQTPQPEAAAMFMTAGLSNSRAATEPSLGPDLDDIAEIEMLDNTSIRSDPK